MAGTNFAGKLLRAVDVAEILNISIPFAYKLMQIGMLPTVRMGRSVRVRGEDLIDFIKSKEPQNECK